MLTTNVHTINSNDMAVDTNLSGDQTDGITTHVHTIHDLNNAVSHSLCFRRRNSSKRFLDILKIVFYHVRRSVKYDSNA